MLLINIHQLQVILAQPVTLAALELEVENIRSILRLKSQDIFVLSSAKNFSERGKVDTESYIAIAAVGREALGLEHH